MKLLFFKSANIDCDDYSSYRSPLPICFRILDSVFAEGIEALFRFALALMKKNEEQLLTMGFDEAVPLLAAKVFDVYIRESDDTTSEQDISSDRPYSSRSSPKQAEQSYKVNEFVRCVVLKIVKFGGTV